MGRSRRTLPEELLLLALDPATGTTAQPQSLDLGLAGAQLVELALAGRIAPDGDRIAVVHPRPTGDPTLDSALELLRRRGSPVRAVHWIGGPRLGLRQIYLAHLERCGHEALLVVEDAHLEALRSAHQLDHPGLPLGPARRAFAHGRRFARRGNALCFGGCVRSTGSDVSKSDQRRNHR